MSHTVHRTIHIYFARRFLYYTCREKLQIDDNLACLCRSCFLYWGKKETGSTALYSLPAARLLFACFLSGTFLEFEDRSSMFLRKVSECLTALWQYVKGDNNFRATKLYQSKRKHITAYCRSFLLLDPSPKILQEFKNETFSSKNEAFLNRKEQKYREVSSLRGLLFYLEKGSSKLLSSIVTYCLNDMASSPTRSYCSHTHHR